MIQHERAKRADGGQPMYDPLMSIYGNGGSVVIGIPSVAQKIHNFRCGDKARVEIYPDGIWIGADTDE